MFSLEPRNAIVWGVVGNLGGGKTMTAVGIAVEAMRQGYFVVSNVTLNMRLICDMYGGHLVSLYQKVDLSTSDPFHWPAGDPRGSGGKRRVIVVLDECAEWFDQYAVQTVAVKRMLSWLRHSSKRSQDVFLVVQRMDFLSKSLRILVERWVWVDDLATYRLPVVRMRLPFCGGWIMQNMLNRQGEKIAPTTFARKAWWGQFYSTSECLSVASSYVGVYAAPVEPRKMSFWLFLWIVTMGVLAWV